MQTSYILSRNKAINIKRRSECGREKEGVEIERIECRTLKNDYFAWTKRRRERKLSERRKIKRISLHVYYSRNMSETHLISIGVSRLFYILRLCIINTSYASFASFFCYCCCYSHHRRRCCCCYHCCLCTFSWFVWMGAPVRLSYYIHIYKLNIWKLIKKSMVPVYIIRNFAKGKIRQKLQYVPWKQWTNFQFDFFCRVDLPLSLSLPLRFHLASQVKIELHQR